MKRILPVLLILIILISGISTRAYSSVDDIAEKRYESGMECFEKQDYEQAFSYFLIAGEVKGYAPAQNMLGICYRDGLGIEQNSVEAERFFKLASDQGYQDATDNLAKMGEEKAEAYRKTEGPLAGEYDAGKEPPIITETGIDEWNHPIIKFKSSKSWQTYEIFRSETIDGEYLLFGSTGGVSKSFTNRNVQEGKTYYYKVRGKNASGEASYFSDIVSITIPKNTLTLEQGNQEATDNLTKMNEEEEREEAYQEAIDLFFDGNYDEAKAIFESLKGYERSADFIIMCDKMIKDEKALSSSGKWLEIGDIVEFGHYEQDNDPANGKEAIEWLVLNIQDNKALLISKYGLDYQQYNSEYTNVTWEDCTLRKWLNKDFKDAAFSAEEQKCILMTTVSADKNPENGTDPVNDTEDKIFILSVEEANYYFSSDEERYCEATILADMARAHRNGSGTSNTIMRNFSWWLRTPGAAKNRAAGVDSSGKVVSSGRSMIDVFRYLGVRPVFRVDLSDMKLR